MQEQLVLYTSNSDVMRSSMSKPPRPTSAGHHILVQIAELWEKRTWPYLSFALLLQIHHYTKGGSATAIWPNHSHYRACWKRRASFENQQITVNWRTYQ